MPCERMFSDTTRRKVRAEKEGFCFCCWVIYNQQLFVSTNYIHSYLKVLGTTIINLSVKSQGGLVYKGPRLHCTFFNNALFAVTSRQKNREKVRFRQTFLLRQYYK